MMKNEYLNRAKVILENVYDENYRSNYKTSYSEQCILEAMCQLAEEVLLNMNTKLLLAKYPNSLYTKEQVEELLQKQRELSNSVHEDEILLHKIKLD